MANLGSYIDVISKFIDEYNQITEEEKIDENGDYMMQDYTIGIYDIIPNFTSTHNLGRFIMENVRYNLRADIFCLIVIFNGDYLRVDLLEEALENSPGATKEDIVSCILDNDGLRADEELSYSMLLYLNNKEGLSEETSETIDKILKHHMIIHGFDDVIVVTKDTDLTLEDEIKVINKKEQLYKTLEERRDEITSLTRKHFKLYMDKYNTVKFKVYKGPMLDEEFKFYFKSKNESSEINDHKFFENYIKWLDTYNKIDKRSIANKILEYRKEVNKIEDQIRDYENDLIDSLEVSTFDYKLQKELILTKVEKYGSRFIDSYTILSEPSDDKFISFLTEDYLTRHIIKYTQPLNKNIKLEKLRSSIPAGFDKIDEVNVLDLSTEFIVDSYEKFDLEYIQSIFKLIPKLRKNIGTYIFVSVLNMIDELEFIMHRLFIKNPYLLIMSYSVEGRYIEELMAYPNLYSSLKQILEIILERYNTSEEIRKSYDKMSSLSHDEKVDEICNYYLANMSILDPNNKEEKDEIMRKLLNTSIPEGIELKAAFIKNNYYPSFDSSIDLKGNNDTVIYLLNELAKK